MMMRMVPSMLVPESVLECGGQERSGEKCQTERDEAKLPRCRGWSREWNSGDEEKDEGENEADCGEHVGLLCAWCVAGIMGEGKG